MTTTLAPRAPVSSAISARVSSTPGRLTSLLLLLAALAVAAGGIGVLGASQRADAVASVRTRTGPLTIQAQELYRSLSDADATAASAFLAGGVEPRALRDRYQQDIAAAGAALASLAAGTDTSGQDAVARITTGLPVYTGLVETARAVNRQGAPLGAAYLREASGLMRQQLLPAAQRLYQVQTRALESDRDAAGKFPWFALPLALVSIGVLVLAQRYISRRTRRTFNVPLVAATAAGVLSALWLGASGLVTAGDLYHARVNGNTQVQALAQVRIAALQARADEALTLVARGNGAAFEDDYKATMARLLGKDGKGGGELSRLAASAPSRAARARVTTAADLLAKWNTAHVALRQLDDTGRFPEAVTAAIGTAPTSTASIFNQLDAALAAGIAAAESTFEHDATSAAGAGAATTTAVTLLNLLLLAGVVVGFQRRIAEYR